MKLKTSVEVSLDPGGRRRSTFGGVVRFFVRCPHSPKHPGGEVISETPKVLKFKCIFP